MLKVAGVDMTTDEPLDLTVGKMRKVGAQGNQSSTPARQLEDAPLGRKGVHLHGVEVHPERREKLAGLLHLLDPLDQLAHPDNAAVVGLGATALVLRPSLGALYMIVALALLTNWVTLRLRRGEAVGLRLLEVGAVDIALQRCHGLLELYLRRVDQFHRPAVEGGSHTHRVTRRARDFRNN